MEEGRLDPSVMRPASLFGQMEHPELAQVVDPPPDPAERALEALRAVLAAKIGGQRVRSDAAALMAYSYDATGERRPPDIVVFPAGAGDVQEALQAASRDRVTVLARGAGTNLSGGTMPLFGGLVLAMQGVDQPAAVDAAHLTAHVGAGVVNANLQRALAAYDLFYPPDPSSHRISTLGGNIQENSGGPHAFRHGVTETHVLALNGFLATGEAVSLRRPAVPGELDLLGVVIGSEGTLVVGTDAVVEVRRRAEGTTTVLMAFPDVAAACRAVAAIVAARLEPAALELLDRATVELVERHAAAGYPLDAGAVLLADLDGTDADRRAQVQALDRVTDGPARIVLRTAESPQAAERLWLGRRVAYGALARVSAHVFVQDVTVPRPALADMMDEVAAIAARHRLRVLTVAHAGDGNLHPSIAYDPADADEVARLHAADRDILAAAAARDGSITGEHGVGIDKLKHLGLMYTADERWAMADVKRVFDPDGRLNPGKAIWTREPETADAPRAHITHPDRVASIQAQVRDAAAAGRQLRPVGAGLRVPPPDGAAILPLSTRGWAGIDRLDVDNLTALVGAGVRAGDLDDALEGTGLEWAVDPLDPAETVGGMVAGAHPQFREASTGPVRSQVLGVEAVDGRGRALRFGRPILKNVAGYDITKLLVGSFGRLGVITTLTLRLRPRRELMWRRVPLPSDRLAAAAWLFLSRPDRPAAVMGWRGALVTAWERSPPPEAGEEIDDPRQTWGRALRAALAEGAHFTAIPRGDPPPVDHLGWWWPLSGVLLTEARGQVAATPPGLARDPAALRLECGVVDAFDPHHVFGEGVRP